jgi:hypothetical protein
MTKEEAIKILELTRDGYLKKANNARSFDQGTFAEMFEDKTIALNMAICALRASNRPSDERKGEGWSTISVEENVGSNRRFSTENVCTYIGDKVVCTIVADKDKESLLQYLIATLKRVDEVTR